ncbi:hypothetical protein [Cupriavidus sp. DL-D2]|uniref:hypothetical protein n=1 Tax=Cupriavidus sp. DL-D2 TaxID=3144974 RepID=UPI003214C808
MKSKLLLTGLMAAVLSACGGGGDGGSTTPTVTTKVSGTAAVGAAIGNALVQAKCASGSGTATTAADGTFTINIPNVTRPCVLSVTTADGTVLHSVVEAGTDTAVVANITPLTELITAALAQGDTNAFFTLFDTKAQERLTAANLATATGTVRQQLAGYVDLTSVDAIKGTLVAANGSNAGNGLDKLLDQLGELLKKSGTSVSELSTAFATNAGTTAIKTVLQPASATCAGLRTGKYWAVSGANIAPAQFDASTLQLSITNPLSNVLPAAMALTPTTDLQASAVSTVMSLTPTTDQNCRFTAGTVGSATDFMVSKSGIALVHVPGSQTVSGFLIPAQEISLAELAGDWNALGYERNDNSVLESTRITFTLGADGKFSAGADCTGVNTCTPWAAGEMPTLAATSNGAFTLTDQSGTANVVAFKGTDGQYTAVITHEAGILVASKQVVRAMPVVGSKSTYWDMTYLPGQNPAYSADGTVISTVDAASSVYTRKRNSDGRVDSWKQNSPVNGLRYRAKSSDLNARESISMTLGNTGVGILISIDPASLFYDISVLRP